MRFSRQLLGFLALVTANVASAPTSSTSGFIGAQPVSESAGFQITNLTTHAPSGHSKTDTNRTISFVFSDGNPTAKASSLCNATWVQGSGQWPQGGYTACHNTNGNSSMSFNFASFTNIYEFDLQVQHEFVDPSLGPPPYDYRGNFGSTNITKHQVGCERMKSGSLDCRMPTKAKIAVPITETDG